VDTWSTPDTLSSRRRVGVSPSSLLCRLSNSQCPSPPVHPRCHPTPARHCIAHRDTRRFPMSRVADATRRHAEAEGAAQAPGPAGGSFAGARSLVFMATLVQPSSLTDTLRLARCCQRPATYQQDHRERESWSWAWEASLGVGVMTRGRRRMCRIQVAAFARNALLSDTWPAAPAYLRSCVCASGVGSRCCCPQALPSGRQFYSP
jgi:hypothetical protein